MSVNVDELDDYGNKSQIILCKGKLLEHDIDKARNYLQRIYYEILGEIDVELVEAVEYSSQAILPTY